MLKFFTNKHVPNDKKSFIKQDEIQNMHTSGKMYLKVEIKYKWNLLQNLHRANLSFAPNREVEEGRTQRAFFRAGTANRCSTTTSMMYSLQQSPKRLQDYTTMGKFYKDCVYMYIINRILNYCSQKDMYIMCILW